MENISSRFAISTSRVENNGRLAWKVIDLAKTQVRYYKTKKAAHMAVASVLNKVM